MERAKALKIISTLEDQGVPRKAINRYIRAMLSNYHDDKDIYDSLAGYSDLAEDMYQDGFDNLIENLLEDGTLLAEAMEVYPTYEAVKRCEKSVFKELSKDMTEEL